MGCAQSRVDNEEAVARCKDRRNVIKEAVTASKAFAAGHFAYAIALKNAGAALSDYGHGESDQTLDAALEKGNDRAADGPATPQPPPPPPIENLPPPPPPLPQFTPSPIKRAISLPAMAGRGRKVRGIDSMAIEEEDEEEEEEEEGEEKVEDGESSPRTPENVGKGGKLPETPETVSASPGAWDYFFRVEDVPGGNLEDNHHFEFNEEEEEEEEEEELRSGHKAVEEVEPKTPEKVEEVEEEEDEVVEEAKEKGKAKIEHSNTAPPEFRRAVAKTTASSVNLMKILDGIDDRFLKASECAQEVSKMLEATRLHYHSNFADNRGIESRFL